MSTLAQYEAMPGFQKRSMFVEAEVRLAIEMGRAIRITDIARSLQVPPRVATNWLGRLMAKLGMTKARMVPDGDDIAISIGKGLPQ